MPAVIGSGGGGGSGRGHVALGPIALAANTPLTVCRFLAPPNRRVLIRGYGFYFDGTSNSAQPVQIRIGRISTDGTYAATGLPGPDDDDLPPTFAVGVGLDASAEPTYSNYLKTLTVHPQLGCEYMAPQGQEIIVKGGGMLGFECTAPAGVNVRGSVSFVE
jgi:hypothetical protein